jgi:hypothetical protein
MRSDGDESHIGAGAGSHNTMEAVASYWAREKNRFRLSHLERKVFSWSVRDVFNRDLLRREVTTCTEHPFGGGFANVILHSYYARCHDLAAFDLLFEGFVFSFVRGATAMAASALACLRRDEIQAVDCSDGCYRLSGTHPSPADYICGIRSS